MSGKKPAEQCYSMQEYSVALQIPNNKLMTMALNIEQRF